LALAPGTRLGPYEILAPLGAGGMGEVYRAHDPRLGRDVAVKVSATQFSDRFEREARAIAALNHPHICTLHDIGPNYLVMELIEGSPLGGPLPVPAVLRHATQIADALAAAHAKGITHRDLKPANILVTVSGVKLLDFGLALVKHVAGSAVSTVDTAATVMQTSVGTVLGTAAYMSPEQAEGRLVDSRSDIFSFGLVVYEILSGRRAFAGDSAIAVMAAIMRDEPAPLDCPPALQEIVRRCLRKSPADRFQSMTDVRDALVAAAGATSFGGSASVSASGDRTPSIAVLPFVNIGGDKENEYFSDGLGEDIITLLSRIDGVKVIARTSAFAFRGKEVDIRTIASTLGVTTVLEGSVRRAAGRIRVTAQLVGADSGAHLWSARYDRELADVFLVQDEIASAIATALSATFSRQAASTPHHRPVVAAYEAVLRARFHLNKVTPESMARARECLEEAIAIDPGYALPHSVLGGCYVSPAVYGMIAAHDAMPQARAAYGRALAIEPTLPEALVGMAAICMFYDYDWPMAARHFDAAKARGPLHGGARVRYGHYLLCTGQTDTAVQEHEGAVEGDPLNLQLRSLLGVALMAANRHADAASQFRRVLDLNDNFHLAQLYLSQACVQLGELDNALAHAERAYALAPWSRPGAGQLAGLLGLRGDKSRAQEILASLGDGAACGASVGLAFYHLLGGEIDAAADATERAISLREPLAVFLALLPVAAELRRSARWPMLAGMMNLPRVE
jgi:eukaryotic-like serine/threonine-protein kinase